MNKKYDCVVLTYNVPHRKTYDTLCLLKACGYSDVLVWAVPMHYKKKFRPKYEHRPELVVKIAPEELCRNLGYDYVLSENGYGDLDIPADTPVLVCGAGIIPDDFVKAHKVINAHPGYIPLARGLDAFKWAIVEDLPIGVTSHLIGDEVDAGYVFERREIPVYENDTFHALAQRVYENEIQMLVDAIRHTGDELTHIPAGENELHRRMPPETEQNLMKSFDLYIQKHHTEKE